MKTEKNKGFYIKSIDGLLLPDRYKVEFLRMNFHTIDLPVAPDKILPGLLAIVENSGFDACLHVRIEVDLRRASKPDERKITWLRIPDMERFKIVYND